MFFKKKEVWEKRYILEKELIESVLFPSAFVKKGHFRPINKDWNLCGTSTNLYTSSPALVTCRSCLQHKMFNIEAGKNIIAELIKRTHPEMLEEISSILKRMNYGRNR